MAGQTILVVEDDDELRQTLTRALTRAGYQVLEAANGKAAVRLLQSPQLPADLCGILLDMQLPEQSGVSVLEVIGPIGEVVPVIAMSGSAIHLQQAAAAGARETIAKPFALAELLAVVRRYCPGP
jgi:CheY-like chemotaxis protein